MSQEAFAMHRTQVLLEDEQYQVLSSRARLEGRSMAALVREVLKAGLENATPGTGPAGRLKAAKGVFRVRATRGRDHNLVLYGGK